MLRKFCDELRTHIQKTFEFHKSFLREYSDPSLEETTEHVAEEQKQYLLIEKTPKIILPNVPKLLLNSKEMTKFQFDRFYSAYFFKNKYKNEDNPEKLLLLKIVDLVKAKVS